VAAARLAKVSCVTGFICLGAFGIALALFQLFPAGPGHQSAAYSAAGPILLLLSFVSFLFAPVALVTGILALLALPSSAVAHDIVAALLGVCAGGVYVAILIWPT
jgi:hypothetical protein